MRQILLSIKLLLIRLGLFTEMLSEKVTFSSNSKPRLRQRLPILKWSRLTSWSIFVLLFLLLGTARADDFLKLDEAIPGDFVADLAPVFDFDTDSCLPSAGISRSGEQNGGLNPSGTITGQCRSSDFLDTSNTLHRYACTSSNGSIYCSHFFALYFEKDQTIDGPDPFGHRHDWENAIIWTVDGVVTHGSVSAHGDLDTRDASSLPMENGHLKVVYHKEEPFTHALRFAKTDEPAENPYGRFVTPTITSWYNMTGDGIDNATMRANLNIFDYGSANVPVRDDKFWVDLNNNRPNGYPYFPAQDFSLSVSLDPVIVGESFSYTGTLKNNGPDVTHTTVVFFLADGLVFTSGAVECHELTANIIICDVGTLLADETKTIFVNTQVTQSVANSIVTYAQANIETGYSTDPNTISLLDSVATSVVRMNIFLNDSVDPVRAGESLKYTATLINNGSDVSKARVQFALAGGLIFIDGSDGCLEVAEGIISCDVGMLLANETKAVIVDTLVTQSVANSIVTSAKAFINRGDDTSLNNIVTTDNEITNVIRVIYLPLVGNNASPDLIVENVEFIGGNVFVTIVNQGTSAIDAPFWVDLYVDPDPIPNEVNQIWADGRSQHGLVWGVTAEIPVGGTLTLTINDPYYWESLSHWPTALSEETPIYVQVDSTNAETTWGGVLELHELIGTAYNNIIGPIYFSEGDSAFIPGPATNDKPEDSVDQLPLR